MNSITVKKNQCLLAAMGLTVFALCLVLTPAFAAPVAGTKEVKEILEQMIGIVGLIFSAVGVILAVYSVGQLVLAFKNEDADSKSRASTMLVVAVVLICFPMIVNGLGLVDKIGK